LWDPSSAVTNQKTRERRSKGDEKNVGKKKEESCVGAFSAKFLSCFCALFEENQPAPVWREIHAKQRNYITAIVVQMPPAPSKVLTSCTLLLATPPPYSLSLTYHHTPTKTKPHNLEGNRMVNYLFAIDESEPARCALESTLPLIQKDRDQIFLCHVVEDLSAKVKKNLNHKK
jgi:hypothetical protein